MNATPIPTALDVLAARDRLRHRIAPSPLRRSEWLSRRLNADVYLKLEVVQPTCAFKIRGALNAMLRLAAEHRGTLPTVVTASAGNHGQAMGIAARELGMHLTVYTPHTAPAVKKDAIRALGATLRDESASYDDADNAARAHATDTGSLFISPYTHIDVIAGAGTIGLEIAEALPRVDAVIVPVGGGGLLSGVGLAMSAASDAAIVGVEAAASTPFATGIARGAITTIDVQPSLADGLTGNLEPNAITFDLVRRLADRLIAVDEGDLRRAIRGLAREEHLIVEGAGAAATAGLLSGKAGAVGQRIVVLVTGGNIDLPTLTTILASED